jgi:hypothetical protein
VARSRVVLLISILLWGSAAEAQTTSITGMVTAHVGATHGSDVRDASVTAGASMAVIEATGWGAEIDVAHAWRFDRAQFAESGISSLMLNVIGMWPRNTLRPFGSAGVGLIRVRADLAGGAQVLNRTDWGFNAGGGLVYMLDENIGLRGDVRYLGYLQNQPDLPLLDNRFGFWRTSVGVTIAWGMW